MMNVTIIGRPNTGKSTLFNALTGTRDALVHNRPGVTRDVISGNLVDRPYQLFDTAGLENSKIGITAASTDMAIKTFMDSDAVLFVVDGQSGLGSEDLNWAKFVHRKIKVPVLLLVNKAESPKKLGDVDDFYKLGFGHPILISAEHKQGFDKIYEFLDKIADKNNLPREKSETVESNNKLKIAILGQPNVGKSTFVNRVLGQQRQIVNNEPGITRDTIKIPTKFYGRDIVLMDTAGLRKKSGVKDDIEILSALKSLDSIKHSDIVVLLVDATKNIENQALTIATKIYDAGKILCIALNKWDLINPEERDEKLLKLKHQFTNSFHQIVKPLILPISAKTGTGVQNLFKRIYEQWDISNLVVPTSFINRIIQNAILHRQPPMSKLKRPMKIKFARQIGKHPIKIIINVGGASDIPESYNRYLRRFLAKELNWEHLPIEIEYKKAKNPYD